MAATPITASTRFFHRGKTKVYYLPTVVDISSPTRLELNGGTDLSDEVSEISGWVTTAGEIETPDLGSTFGDKIPGTVSIDDSTITFYASQSGADVRTLLPRDTAGFIAILHGGDVAANKMDVFPVRVRALGKPIDLGDTAATVQVSFSITSTPAENVAVPA